MDHDMLDESRQMLEKANLFARPRCPAEGPAFLARNSLKDSVRPPRAQGRSSMSSRRTRERLARMPRAVRLGGAALALAVFGSVWAAPARADVIIQCESVQNGTNVPG